MLKMNDDQAFNDEFVELGHSSYDLTGLNGEITDPIIPPTSSFSPNPFFDGVSGDTSQPPIPFMANTQLSVWDAAMGNPMPQIQNSMLVVATPDVPINAGLPPVPSLSHDTSTSSLSQSNATHQSSRATSSTTLSKPSRPPSKASATPSRPNNSEGEGSRKSRKINQKSKAIKTEPEEPEIKEEKGDSKRGRFLERNRIAASKCRQKKKEWVSGLEETKSGLEHRHESLQRELRQLVDEVSDMKTQLMRHANCNDPIINAWIEAEARKYVLRATEQHARAMGSISGLSGPQNHSRHGKTPDFPPSLDAQPGPEADKRVLFRFYCASIFDGLDRYKTHIFRASGNQYQLRPHA